MKKAKLFQGEKYLSTQKSYFEGWYFKHTQDDFSIALIPGISIHSGIKKAFIQVITLNQSYNIDFPIEDFNYQDEPFSIQIGSNYFDERKIILDLNSPTLTLKGELHYHEWMHLSSSIFCPNIMGFFSYLPFMECFHGILTMKGIVEGQLSLNETLYTFHNGIYYIEKDWGRSFPKSYVWIQANDFQDKEVAFMFSKAMIPFGFFHFNGHICSLMIKNQEYRFATYNGSKIIYENQIKDYYILKVKKGGYLLSIEAKMSDGHPLLAPINGAMGKTIVESLSSKIKITLHHDSEMIFNGISNHGGLEIVSK